MKQRSYVGMDVIVTLDNDVYTTSTHVDATLSDGQEKLNENANEDNSEKKEIVMHKNIASFLKIWYFICDIFKRSVSFSGTTFLSNRSVPTEI